VPGRPSRSLSRRTRAPKGRPGPEGPGHPASAPGLVPRLVHMPSGRAVRNGRQRCIVGPGGRGDPGKRARRRTLIRMRWLSKASTSRQHAELVRGGSAQVPPASVGTTRHGLGCGAAPGDSSVEIAANPGGPPGRRPPPGLTTGKRKPLDVSRWSLGGGSVSCCHARSALLRRGLLPAPRPLLPAGRPPRRSRADPLPEPGGLARVVAGADRPPLPGQGLRRPQAGAGRT
jgi:hypothetical protein